MHVCHSEPFAVCHPERSEGYQFLAQGKLREESHRINTLENRDSSANALTPHNDITKQSSKRDKERESFPKDRKGEDRS